MLRQDIHGEEMSRRETRTTKTIKSKGKRRHRQGDKGRQVNRQTDKLANTQTKTHNERRLARNTNILRLIKIQTETSRTETNKQTNK